MCENYLSSSFHVVYEVVKILFRHKYIHVFICEYGNIYWNIKFSKSLIEGIKNWLKRKQEYENNN